MASDIDRVAAQKNSGGKGAKSGGGTNRGGPNVTETMRAEHGKKAPKGKKK